VDSSGRTWSEGSVLGDEPGEPMGAWLCALLIGFPAGIFGSGLPSTLNTGKREHCYVGCKIEKSCGLGTGYAAAEIIEYIQGNGWGKPWDKDDLNGIEAAKYGASIGAKCGTDCEKACIDHYAPGD
jgi:hypothetical protein